MAGKLDGKVIIITGCSGGIGKDTAIRFAQEGASLAICARNFEKLSITKEICEREGAKVLAVKCDVTIPEELESFVAETVNTFGRIDVLLNNAINAKPGTPFLEQPEEVLMEVFNSGYLATWRMMKLCFPYLKESRGNIINFASASGLKGTKGYAAYGSIKEAIRGLTRTVANEWGEYGIVANVILPTAITDRMQAYIDAMPEGKRNPQSIGFTTMPPVGRIGTAYDDITPILVFLASDGCKYLTGQSIRADGGGSIFGV